MAKLVKLPTDQKVGGIDHKAGSVISVSESLFVQLGLPEYVEQSSKKSGQ